MQEFAVVHYNEIGLKGANRSFFERALARNLERALKGLNASNAKRLPGRVIVPLSKSTDRSVVTQRLSRIFGVANFGIAAGDRMDLDRIRETALARATAALYWETFAIRARLAHSAFELSARELNEKVGAYVLEATKKKVDLSNPDLTIYIEIVGDLVLIYAGREAGLGGLPVGVSGRSVALLSAGIDSPVAAARMMQRGSKCIFVHFHSQPFTDASSVRQVDELAQILTQLQYDSSLYLLPLAPAQQAIVGTAPQELRTLLYRRMMMRISELVAKQENAKALVTGDSLGQVASQTMENLAVVEDAATMPVLRPHIARDKNEIIAEAIKLGTFEISSAPCQEACVLFEPKRPATKATIEAARKAEEDLDVEMLAKESFVQAELRTYRWPQ
ncbi:MAG: tRNA uracil 4-sulfurtransferase ThiI [Actinomycetota bacterium]